MDMIAKAFLADIDKFLQQAGVDPTALGKQAMGDPSFVFDLKKGRSPSTRTMERCAPGCSSSALPQRRPGLTPQPQTPDLS